MIRDRARWYPVPDEQYPMKPEPWKLDYMTTRYWLEGQLEDGYSIKGTMMPVSNYTTLKDCWN